MGDDRRYNFVAAEKFESEDEKHKMIKPNARSEGDLFVHDTLYNIQIKDQGSYLVMECWTGDMQLTIDGKISRNQAEGKTVITLDKSVGKASMDIGGGFGQEKWVMTLEA